MAITEHRYTYGPLRVTVSDFRLRPTGLRNGRRTVYELADALVVRMWCYGCFFRVIVPSGFKTDLATIPLFAVPFVGTTDSFIAASVVHDFCCVQNIPRWPCNALLRALMEVTGNSSLKCKAVFWAVQICGYASPISGFFTRRNIKRVQNGHSKC